jgi:hypothetical protein
LRIETFVSDSDSGVARYGLDDRSPYFRVFHEGGEFPTKITLGAVLSENPRLCYARIDGIAAVVAVSEGMRRLADYELDIMRDRKVLAIAPAELTAIKISKPGESSVSLARAQDGSWSITAPKNWPADVERLQSMLSPWLSARIATFHDLPKLGGGPLSAGPVQLEVEFTGAVGPQGEQQTVQIYERNSNTSGLLIRTLPDDTWCSVIPADIRYTSADPLFYRDRVILNLASEEAREILRKTIGHEASLVREDASQPWQDPSAANQPDLDIVSRLLKFLAPLRAQRLLEYEPSDLARYQLDQPRIVLTIGLAGATGISRTLLVGGRDPEGFTYAMVRGQDMIFLLDKELADLLDKPISLPRAADAPGTNQRLPN